MHHLLFRSKLHTKMSMSILQYHLGVWPLYSLGIANSRYYLKKISQYICGTDFVLPNLFLKARNMAQSKIIISGNFWRSGFCRGKKTNLVQLAFSLLIYIQILAKKTKETLSKLEVAFLRECLKVTWFACTFFFPIFRTFAGLTFAKEIFPHPLKMLLFYRKGFHTIACMHILNSIQKYLRRILGLAFLNYWNDIVGVCANEFIWTWFSTIVCLHCFHSVNLLHTERFH